MKRNLRNLLIVSLCLLAMRAMSQEPPHPNNGNSPTAGNTPVGSNAPVGSGLGVFLLLAAAYASKSYMSNKSIPNNS
jgi:hypothetical protein